MSNRWMFPLLIWDYNGLPINYHPGSFGFKRRKNYHPGIDLYTINKANVFACEPGVIVKIDVFTGPKLGTDWWLETWAVMVEGETGVINYGEILPLDNLNVGDLVNVGDKIGNVIPVLKEGKERPDIPGHSRFMLHLELYKHGSREFAHWREYKDPNLLDPTPYLISSSSFNWNFLTWDNPKGLEVG